MTAIVDEHYGDTSRMFCVGKTPVKVNNLIDATYESMMRAINLLKPGLKLGDIGYEIQSFVEKKGYSVVRDFCGHGIVQHFTNHQMFCIMEEEIQGWSLDLA